MDEKSANAKEKNPSKIELVQSEPNMEDVYKKQLEEKDEIIKTQQLMMLGQMVVNKDDPFEKASTYDELKIIEQIKAIKEKYVKEGITQAELHEMYRLMNLVTKQRETKLDYRDRGTIGKEDMVAKTFDERRILDMQVPPGFRGQIEVDTPSLGGSRIKRLLNMGYRMMRNDGTIHCEADGEIWNPKCQADIVMRRYGFYGSNPEPATYYLLVIAACIDDERRRIRSSDSELQHQNNIDHSIEEITNLINSSGEFDLDRKDIRISRGRRM